MNLTSIPARVSAGLLSVILLIVYFLILTPIIRWRGRNRNLTLGLNDANSTTGWIDNEQSSTDLNSYVTMASGRDDLVHYVQTGGDALVLFCYDMLMKFRLLARPPKEKELRSDLYVLF